jgi:abhydrolase domain-containing protein 4
VGNDDKVWTLEMNAECKNSVIVLMHGFGAGLAFWALNLEALATHNPVYAFDILGLSRSSRPNFSLNDPLKIEQVNVVYIFYILYQIKYISFFSIKRR